VKARWPLNPARRACIEIKIWGRNAYREVVSQVMGYAIPDDDFTCVIMLDRKARPLREVYRDECLAGGTLLWAGEADKVSYPAFVSRHARPSGRPLRVYHFIVQLPPDGA
jgi:hypothetical protein